MLSSLHRLRQQQPIGVDSPFLPDWIPGPPRRFDKVMALEAETALVFAHGHDHLSKIREGRAFPILRAHSPAVVRRQRRLDVRANRRISALIEECCVDPTTYD